MMERLSPERYDTLEGIADPAETPVLFGHAEAADRIAAAYRAGKLHHALLLAGPRGIGKATLAFHVARHLLGHPNAAEAPDRIAPADPHSPLFRQVAMRAHPALLHLTRPRDDRTGKFRTVITVDEVRGLGRFLSLTTHDGGWRVVVADAVDDMNVNAANALLKNLEEPPPRTLFLLLAHSLGSVLPTIRSRAQTIRLQPLSEADMAPTLAALSQAMPAPEHLAALLRLSGGSPRRALLLTEFGGLEIATTLRNILQADQPDMVEAHRLADAVSGREAGITFELFNEQAMMMVADAATQAALSGDLARAGRLSGAHREIGLVITETEIYNLDRKQHVLSMISSLSTALRM